jgi:hypothetical protein
MAVDDMKINSAPGHDGLHAEFYKCFWEKIKGPVCWRCLKKIIEGS